MPWRTSRSSPLPPRLRAGRHRRAEGQAGRSRRQRRQRAGPGGPGRRGRGRGAGVPGAGPDRLFHRRPAAAGRPARRGRGGDQTLAKASAKLAPLFVVGAPLRDAGRLYNTAVAIQGGKVRGVIPKSFLPNYREFYERRWFTPGAGVTGKTLILAGEDVPFGTDILLRCRRRFAVHGRCRDLRGRLDARPAQHRPGHGRGRDPAEPVGQQHHHRQVRDPPPAVRQPVVAGHRGLCLFGGRGGRELDRRRLGRPRRHPRDGRPCWPRRRASRPPP
jgi:hypothetical protein